MVEPLSVETEVEALRNDRPNDIRGTFGPSTMALLTNRPVPRGPLSVLGKDIIYPEGQFVEIPDTFMRQHLLDIETDEKGKAVKVLVKAGYSDALAGFHHPDSQKMCSFKSMGYNPPTATLTCPEKGPKKAERIVVEGKSLSFRWKCAHESSTDCEVQKTWHQAGFGYRTTKDGGQELVWRFEERHRQGTAPIIHWHIKGAGVSRGRARKGRRKGDMAERGVVDMSAVPDQYKAYGVAEIEAAATRSVNDHTRGLVKPINAYMRKTGAIAAEAPFIRATNHLPMPTIHKERRVKVQHTLEHFPYLQNLPTNCSRHQRLVALTEYIQRDTKEKYGDRFECPALSTSRVNRLLERGYVHTTRIHTTGGDLRAISS